MFLKTTQKFFSVRNKFSIVNINDDQLFFAQEHFKVRQNCTLYNMDSSVIYELECKICDTDSSDYGCILFYGSSYGTD